MKIEVRNMTEQLLIHESHKLTGKRYVIYYSVIILTNGLIKYIFTCHHLWNMYDSCPNQVHRSAAYLCFFLPCLKNLYVSPDHVYNEEMKKTFTRLFL